MVRRIATALLLMFGLAGCAYDVGTPDYIPFEQDWPTLRSSYYVGDGYGSLLYDRRYVDPHYRLGYGAISEAEREKQKLKHERKLQKRALKHERKLQKRAFKQERKLAKQQRKQQRKANKRARKAAKRALKYQ